jgi:serine/threonine protein kinase
MAIQAGRVLAGRYRLIRPVGQGSQAAVWIAEHLALSTHVAVKLIDPDLAKRDDARERFRREATAAAGLRSAHVVQILDHGIDGDQPFIVMELLDGEDLFERLERKKRLSLRDTSKILTQVARALARAHAAGVVHRDLKPENVFLVPNEDDEIVKVLDFGVAKIKDSGKATMQKTGVGTLIGTPHYMSPEQVKGIGEVDHRTDIWALGVLAFQCITGELPFDSEGVGDLLIKISMGDLPVPSKVFGGAPPAFDAWFARACERDLAKRFQSAREAAVALAGVVATFGETGATMRPPRPASIPPVAADVAGKSSQTGPRIPTGPPRRPSKPPPPKPRSIAPTPTRIEIPRGPEGKAGKRSTAAGHERKVPEGSPEELREDELEELTDVEEVAPVAVRPQSSVSAEAEVDWDEEPFEARPPAARPRTTEQPSKSIPPMAASEPAGPRLAPVLSLPPAPPPSAPASMPRPPPVPRFDRPPPAPSSRAGPSSRGGDGRPTPVSTPALEVPPPERRLPGTVSGLARSEGSTTDPPPELDGSARRRRLLGFALGGFLLFAATIAWTVLRSQLGGVPASAASESVPPPSVPSPSLPPPAVAPPAVTPATVAVDPGKVSHPLRTAPTISGRPTWKKPPRRPTDGTVEIPDTPDEPAPGEKLDQPPPPAP